MKKLEIYDPPMCCSTGVCGPEVEPRLVQFAADLDWVKGQGVEGARFNLSQEPDAFVSNESVRQALEEDGNDVLPLVMIDGRLMCRGFYPERSQLRSMLGLKETQEDDSSGGCGGSTSCC